MEEELIEVLDENGNNTGTILPKSTIKKEGLFHRTISICILNKDNNILIHRRSDKKRVYPNLWSCFVRGHVKAYESSIEACMRETEEELGIKMSENNIKFLYISKNIDLNSSSGYINNIFFDNYITIIDVKIDDLKFQVDEVSEAKFIDCNQLKRLIDENNSELVPNFEDYNKIISILEKE